MRLDGYRPAPYDSATLDRDGTFRVGVTRMPSSLRIIAAFTIGLALVSVTGCAPSAERQLIGTWRLDAGKSGLGLIDKVGVELTFGGDGKFTIAVSSDVPIIGDASRSGTWKFISEKDNDVNVAYQWNPDDRPTVMVIKLVDADTIRLIPPLGPVKAEVPFRRVEAKQ